MGSKQELLKRVAKYQDEFNSVVDKDWKEKRNLYDWSVALYDEGAEILSSLPWKWWKKVDLSDEELESAIENIKVEVVDAFHFVLSQAIQLAGSVEEMNLPEEEGIERVFNSQKARLSKDMIKEDRFKVSRDFVALANSLVTLSFSVSRKGEEYILLQAFLSLASKVLDFDELIRLYIGKNALNLLRQEMGYKTGGYIKEWEDGLEDNVFMLEVVNTIPVEKLTLETVKEELKKIYLNKIGSRK